MSRGLSNKFNALTGLGKDAISVISSTRTAAKGILNTVDAENNTWGNVIANQVENEMKKIRTV